MRESDTFAAWETLERSERPWLERYLRSRVPPHALDDVLQDTWLAFWRLDDAYVETGRRRALLRRIAERRAADWHRAHRVEVFPSWREAWEADPDFTRHLLRAVGVEPGSLMWHRIVDDWSLPMLAIDAGVPVGPIKSRLWAEKRELARRLGDWHEARERSEGPCVHARSEVLGGPACTRCAPERSARRALITRGGPYDWFQSTYVTVASDLGLWLDVVLTMRQSLAPHKQLWVNGPARLGPFRRVRNAYGQDLASRVRTAADGGQIFLVFPLRRDDGRRLTTTQYGTRSQGDALTVIRASRQQVEIHLDVGFGPAADGATILELPPNLALVHSDPAPTTVTAPHHRPILVWPNAAGLPHYPIVTTRCV